MSEILQYIVTSLISVIATGGLGSIFYVRQQKKLKDLEVKAADVEVQTTQINNLSSSNEEWIKLYNQVSVEKNDLQEKNYEFINKLEEIHNEKKELWDKYGTCQKQLAQKDLVINELNWYRCEMNGCPYRKPPRKYGEHDFPKDGINPEENPDPNSL